MNIPKSLFQEPIEIKNKKTNKPISFKQIAGDNIKVDDKEFKKDVAKKVLNPYFFTDRKLKVGFKINLDSHQICHANSKSNITPF